MTVQTQKSIPTPDSWAAEGDIDLRPYLNILIHRWREISVITISIVVLAAVGVLVSRLLLPARYEASADVAIVRTVSDVNFDERFRTNPEELRNDTASLTARRSALLGLVATGGIAEDVIAQLSDQLTIEERNPANLLAMVESSLTSTGGARNDSDLIRIKVTATDPAKAATIANAWSHIYVREVNTIYGQVPDEVLTSIQNELLVAEQQYLTNQANLEAFITTTHLDALASLVTILQQRIEQEVSLQKAYLVQWEDTQEQLATVAALYTQIEQGGEGAARSTMAALQTLKMNVYGAPPAGLQIEVRDLPDVNQQAMLADLDGLLKALNQRLVDLDSKITVSDTQLGATRGVSSTLSSTLENLRISKAQLEAETAKQRQLTQHRDLAWDTYKTVSGKVTELNLTRAAASSEVRFGAPAVVPTEAVEGLSLSLSLLLAAVVGGVLSLFYAFVAEYLDIRPLVTK